LLAADEPNLRRTTSSGWRDNTRLGPLVSLARLLNSSITSRLFSPRSHVSAVWTVGHDITVTIAYRRRRSIGGSLTSTSKRREHLRSVHRHITEPDSWVNIDDRPIRMVSGDYDVKEDRIRVAFCGNNVGGPGRGGINNMNAYFDELAKRRLAHAK